MKTRKVDRMLTLIAYHIYKIPQVLFSISLVLTVVYTIYYGSAPLIVGYFFWFSLGFFCFSLIIKNATSFLKKKSDENDEYYQDLLDR